MPRYQNILIEKPISAEKLQEIATQGYGNMVKAVVDIEKSIMVIGSEMHVDAETFMIEQLASEQDNLWGINIYPELPKDEWVEFDSMINIRPYQNNPSRGIEDPRIREIIKKIVENLVNEK